MTQKGATEIVAFVDDLLQSEQIRKIKGPINWANLRVVEITEKHYVYPGDCYSISILIEEAAPDNPELKEYVFELVQRKFPGIRFEIETAW